MDPYTKTALIAEFFSETHKYINVSKYKIVRICFNVVISDKRWVLYVKMAILAVVSLLVCTVAISSTGFYFYNKAMGFTTAVVEYVSKTFGSGVSYWGYVAYRLIFKGQIINSLVNYALLFASVPLLNSIKPLKLHLR